MYYHLFPSSRHYPPLAFPAFCFTKYFHSTHTVILLSRHIVFPLLLSLAEETALFYGNKLTTVCVCVSAHMRVCVCIPVYMCELLPRASACWPVAGLRF